MFETRRTANGPFGSSPSAESQRTPPVGGVLLRRRRRPGGFDSGASLMARAMRCQADQERRTETSRSASNAAQGSAPPAALPALQLLIDPDAGRVLVRDRGETFGYQLEYRTGSGLRSGVGWVEYGSAAGGARFRAGVSAAEVMAVARDAGRDERGGGADRVGGGRVRAPARDSKPRRQAARLRREVAAGRELERVSLRAIRFRIEQRLDGGEPLAFMCERGGFVKADGRSATMSWLERRAGLRARAAGRTASCAGRAPRATRPSSGSSPRSRRARTSSGSSDGAQEGRGARPLPRQPRASSTASCCAAGSRSTSAAASRPASSASCRPRRGTSRRAPCCSARRSTRATWPAPSGRRSRSAASCARTTCAAGERAPRPSAAGGRAERRAA